jgi:hypothetical protein
MADEVERMHPSDADWRIAEYELFRAPGFLDWTACQAVERIGFRVIRERYRETSTHG